MKRMIVFLTLGILFVGCSTPYQPKGLLGGYKDKCLDGNIYEVSFWGNQHSNAEDVHRFCLYRCAELSQEKGYNYFAILNKEQACLNNNYWVGGSRQKLQGSHNSPGGSIHSNLHVVTYDFRYIIMLCDNKEAICNEIYYVPEVLEKFSHFVNK